MYFLLLFFIGIGLSMDAFSLSIAYGTLSLPKEKIYSLSLLVGVFHFFMPLLGHSFGSFFSFPDFLISLILIGIGIQMLGSYHKEETITGLSFLEQVLFAFAVSIDSFSVGIGLSTSIILASILFSLISFLFTFFGLSFGKQLHERIGKRSILFGGILLLSLGVFSFLRLSFFSI